MKSFPYPSREKHIHFIGIGGIGMSGIAKILHGLGFTVTGSDLRESPNTIRLRDLGIKIYIGHDPSLVRNATVVVRSSAIPAENKELSAAHMRGTPVWERAEVLGWIMSRSRYRIAVTGTHGKTTTSAMIAHILARAGKNPTFIVGGVVNEHDYNAKLGNPNIVVAEADESDASFLRLSPTHSVITNIEPEHMDHYGNLQSLYDAFQTYIENHPADGRMAVCADYDITRKLLAEKKAPCPVLLYGITEHAKLRAENCVFSGLESTFRITEEGRTLCEAHLRVPGYQNILDALASFSICRELGHSPTEISSALETFRSARRRFQIIGSVRGITIVDDYAHHPTELQMTLEAAKLGWKDSGRVIVIFQPHRYTRTRDLVQEFGKAFHNADEVIITDIYAADERPIQGISGLGLMERVRQNGHSSVHFIGRKESVAQFVLPRLKKGDIVIFAGAGDIYHSAKEMHALLHDQDAYAKLKN